MVSRKGAYSCHVASGVIFAVNVDVCGAAGAPLAAFRQDLLASMQARAPSQHRAGSREHTWGVEACERRR